jgi:hypothetical protein
MQICTPVEYTYQPNVDLISLDFIYCNKNHTVAKILQSHYTAKNKMQTLHFIGHSPYKQVCVFCLTSIFLVRKYTDIILIFKSKKNTVNKTKLKLSVTTEQTPKIFY